MAPWLRIVVACVLAAIGIFIYAVSRRRQRPRDGDGDRYSLGLNAMISGDRDAALRHLKEAARRDPRNVDAYVKVGDLLRERGLTKQAIQVHRELLVKRRLPPGTRREIVWRLSMDLAQAGRWDEIIQTIKELPRSERTDVHLLGVLRDAYEGTGDLDRAAQTHKQIIRAGARTSEPTLGVYRAQLALSALRAGDRARAKAGFQAALKEDPDAYIANLHLGDIAVEEEDTERAIAYWMQIVQQRPDRAHLVFGRLEKAFYDIGDFGRMMSVYADVVGRAPSNVLALCGLSKMQERKGSVEEAIATAREAVKHEGETLVGHARLIEILVRSERYEEAAREAESLLATMAHDRAAARCPSCGRSIPPGDLRCPECRAWTNGS